MISCGGYDEVDSYLNLCQYYEQKNSPWLSADPTPGSTTDYNMTKARAFHSMVVVEKENGDEVLLALGGYNKDDNFLDSVEAFDNTTKKWTEITMKIPEAMSHFCTVYYKVNTPLKIFT